MQRVNLCKKTDHVTQYLKELHWLPIYLRINLRLFLSCERFFGLASSVQPNVNCMLHFENSNLDLYIF